MIYIANPYHHADSNVRQQRFEITCDFVARGIKLGFHMFSPIVYGHSIKKRHPEIPEQHEIWMPLDIAILRHCEAMYLLELNGWEKSYGVQLELKICKLIGIPVVGYKQDGKKFVLSKDEYAHVAPKEF